MAISVEPPVELSVAILRSFQRHPRGSLRNGDAAFRHDDDIARLRRLQQPVLLFKGGGSPDYLREIIDVLGQELPSARVEDLPGAHALHIASMTRFMEIFRAFLKGAVAA